MLWLYRRLPRAYERPPHVEHPIKALAAVLESDVGDFLAERGAAPDRAPSTDSAAGWQPIETAPKDGTEVLLYLGAPWNKVEKAYWFPAWQNWQRSGDKPDTVRDEYCGIGSAIPTHYQLLPAPPVAAIQPEGDKP